MQQASEQPQPGEQNKSPKSKSDQKSRENSKDSKQSQQRRRGRFHQQQRQRSRSNSRQRRFYNNIERWHYQRCSEIKIHFYVKNLYIGNQSEDAYLNFVKERVQKAGHCDLIQISGKNKQEQTIDIAIGMRYDQDAKLIYIGKKHINLASKFNINKNKQICPVISNMFEILLEKNDELDKTKLENSLKRQRQRDHSSTKKHGSSSSKSGSRSSSKRSNVTSPKSRSRSKAKKLPEQPQPQLKAQQPIVQKQLVSQPPPVSHDIKPAQLVHSQPPQRQQQQQHQPQPSIQMSYKPVLLSMNENVKEQVQIFFIPKEFQLVECLQAIQEMVGCHSLPEGTFKSEKSRNVDQNFEYLEVTLEYSQIQKIFANLPIRIKDLPCLACQRNPNMSFRDVLKPYQLFVSPAQRIPSRTIYQHFKTFGEIVAFYTVDSQIRDAEDYILIYAQESSIKGINPPNQLEVLKDPNNKVICNFRYLESVDIQFHRPPYSQTLYAQQQQIQKQHQQRQEQKQQAPVQAPPPPVKKPDIVSESSSSGSSSSKKSASKSSRSGSSGSRNQDQGRNNYYDRNNRRYDSRRRTSNNNNNNKNTYQRNTNYRPNRGGSYNQDDDRRRGGSGGRYNQRQDRGRRYDN